MKICNSVVFLSSIGILQVNGFAPLPSSSSPIGSLRHRDNTLHLHSDRNVNVEASFDPLHLSSSSSSSSKPSKTISSSIASLAAVTALAITPQTALAAGPDWGLFEGRTGSLLHPLMMGGMLLLSLSTALKGFQYRRQRTMGGDISAMRKTLPDLMGASTVSEAIAVAESAEEVDYVRVETLRSALSLEKEIEELVQERKTLAGMNLKDSHFSQGAILAFLGTAFAIEGPLNTYARAGKLFPGPHLYAGAGLVVLWAAAYACVPAMQKGNDTARSIHIGANVAGIGLFAWQVISGWPILLKVIEKTKWP